MLILKEPCLVNESLGYTPDNITKGYAIRVCELNITLDELTFITRTGGRTKKGIGEPTQYPIGYFNRLDQVLQKIYETELLSRLGNEKVVKDLQEFDNDILETIKSCSQKLGKMVSKKYLIEAFGEEAI